MRWVRFDIPCRAESADLVAALVLLETGRGPSATTMGETAVVEAWVPESHAAARRAGLAQRLRAAGLEASGIAATVVEEADWRFAWREFFKPLRVGWRLVVKPSWERWPPADDPGAARPGDVILEVDPGGAFGTGSHPTTQLALAALEKTVRKGDLVLDVGCGSGILSLAAATLGAGRVVGIDNDAGIAECATGNLRGALEEGRARLLMADGLSALRVRADIVVANITAEPVIAVGRSVADCLRPGGLYITTGLLETDVERVTASVSDAGLDHERTELQDGWACVTFRRVGSDPE